MPFFPFKKEGMEGGGNLYTRPYISMLKSELEEMELIFIFSLASSFYLFILNIDPSRHLKKKKKLRKKKINKRMAIPKRVRNSESAVKLNY